MKPRFFQYEYPVPLYNTEVDRHLAAVDEYDEDIHQAMMAEIEAHKPNVELYRQQPYLTPQVRAKLIDFLMKMGLRLKILPFVVAKAVRLFDRYCLKRIVLLDQSQLIITTCLWIAAKVSGGNNHFVNLSNIDKIDGIRTIADVGYGSGGKYVGPTERFRLPKLHELVKLCGAKCRYDQGMFKQMEVHVLLTLEWGVNDAGVDEFLMLLAEFAVMPTVVADSTVPHQLLTNQLFNIKRFLTYASLYQFELVEAHPVHLAHVICNVINETFNLTTSHHCYQLVGGLLEASAPLDFHTYKHIKKYVIKLVLQLLEFILRLFGGKGPQYLYHQVCLHYKFSTVESPGAMVAAVKRQAALGPRRVQLVLAAGPLVVSLVPPTQQHSPSDRKKSYPYTPPQYSALAYSSVLSVNLTLTVGLAALLMLLVSPLFAAPLMALRRDPLPQKHRLSSTTLLPLRLMYKLPSLPQNGIFIHPHHPHPSLTLLTSLALLQGCDDPTGVDIFDYDYCRRQGILTPLLENDSPIFTKH